MSCNHLLPVGMVGVASREIVVCMWLEICQGRQSIKVLWYSPFLVSFLGFHPYVFLFFCSL